MNKRTHLSPLISPLHPVGFGPGSMTVRFPNERNQGKQAHLQRVKKAYEKQGRHGALEQYQVLLSTSTLNLRVRINTPKSKVCGKLSSKFVGQFEVLPPLSHATKPNVMWLKVPRTFHIHMPINVKEIKRYISREADLEGPLEVPPEPIVVNAADHWEVECVLAELTKDRQRFVLWTLE
jgi:hypothetical protein